MTSNQERNNTNNTFFCFCFFNATIVFLFPDEFRFSFELVNAYACFAFTFLSPLTLLQVKASSIHQYSCNCIKSDLLLN